MLSDAPWVLEAAPRPQNDIKINPQIVRNHEKIMKKPKINLSSILLYFSSVVSTDVSCASPTSLSDSGTGGAQDRDVTDAQEMSLDATELK